jgi:hypothetical protein
MHRIQSPMQVYTIGRGKMKFSFDNTLYQDPDCGYTLQLASIDSLGLDFDYTSKTLSWTINIS